MRLKKYLKRNKLDKKGQAIVEYFILLVMLALLTIVSSSVFFKNVKSTTDTFFQRSNQTMAQPNIDAFH